MTCGAVQLLHLFWVLPLLVGLAWWAARRRQRDLSSLFGDRVEQIVGSGLEARRAWSTTLVVLALASFVVAAAQPQWGFTWRDLESRGIEVVIALDVSRSMDAEDVHPSRLSRAKREVADLSQELRGDRIGLVIFAGGAYPRVPLTTDYDALATIVDSTSTGTLRAQGSSLPSAVLTGLEMLGEPGQADQAIIVISDGEDHSDELDEAVIAANDSGVRVYTIGVGTEGGAPVPLEEGGFVDWAGEVVVSSLDDRALKKLASGTGGAYILSTAGAADTRSLAADLHGALTRQAIEVKREKVPDERYQWPLGAGIVLLTLAGLTGDGRRRGLALAALLFLTPTAEAADLDSAKLLMAQGRYDDALVELERLQAQEPTDADIAWEIANARYGAGDVRKAAREFEDLAVRAPDDEMQLEALYNAGNARYRAGELDRAVKNWQQVLALDEDHDAAKANAEQVQEEIQQRLTPPVEQPPQAGPGESQAGEGESGESQPSEEEGEEQEGDQGEPTESESDGTRSDPAQGEPTGDPQEGEGDPSGEMMEALSEASPDAPPSPATPYGVSAMSEEEARKLLDGVEEGTPRVVVRGQSSGKDW
ncbi:MAG: VWA domain-containing protein [Proteobacteria bacterium]|nr:VWA domain-containing protein [Pseudomonadota bacterium]